ncbi:MAG: 50S ribosomal protein L11 methyltransferase [Lachnospiraceae bacterium]|nr:50S ribosomal protein L11 methyltransferase [Lachnospiraceae bacterium]
MKYEKYTIKTTFEAEELIAAELAELGIDGVMISDSLTPEEDCVPVYIDDMPENTVEEGRSHISFFLEEGEDHTELIEKVRSMIADVGVYVDTTDTTIEKELTEDADWLNNWKNYFHQFEIDFEDGETALFIPSWEESEKPDDDYDFVINIDPGTAFGTGAHETTRLCIKEIKKYLRPSDLVLDIGTGSGILSIMALKFGARHAKSIDIDPNCTPAVEKNMEDNDISKEELSLLIDNVLENHALQEELKDSADMVIANILPDVLEPLTPLVPSFLKKDGIYIVSGIIDEKADFVRDILEKNGFKILEKNTDGEWVSYVSLLH